MLRTISLLGLLMILLAACAPAANLPSPTTAPTESAVPEAPTTPPEPTATPSATPSPEPSATPLPEPTVAPPTETAGVAPSETPAPMVDAPPVSLPGPIYSISNGEIIRVERDGSFVQISHEATIDPAFRVVNVAASPMDNQLIYRINKTSDETEPTMALISSDANGDNRTVFLDVPGVNPQAPLWSPDASQIVVNLRSSEGMPGGIYRIPAVGGEPTLLQPDRPFDYFPLAFSPDGQRLLARGYQGEECGLSILSLDGAEPIQVEPPQAELYPSCFQGAWSLDGSAIYTSFTPSDFHFTQSGIWRVDATTGQATALTPGQQDAQYILIRDIATTAHDKLFALLARSASIPQPTAWGVTPEPGSEVNYQIAQIDPSTGAAQILGQNPAHIIRAFWAKDGSGALIETWGANQEIEVFWFAFDGSAPVQLQSPIHVDSSVWASTAMQ